MASPLYSFDTSGWIDPWRRHHPRDIFESLWQRIDELVDGKEIVSCEMVLDELSRKLRKFSSFLGLSNGLFRILLTKN